jgi:S1-C subfamily serine protease
MDEQPEQQGTPWPRPPAAEPTRPLWLDPPTTPPLAESAGGSPPPLPPSPPNPFPAPPTPPKPEPRAARAGAGWLKPAIAGGVVGALVAAGVAGGIVAASDNDTPSTTAAPLVARASNDLAGDKLDVASVLQSVQHGVVAIDVEGTQNGGARSFSAAGTGMVIDSTGLILTNAHVVENAFSIKVSLYDGKQYDADLVGRSTGSDVALVQARGVSGLEPVKFGASKDLQVGDDVVAVGNALNLGATPTVTTGIVSALNRSITADNGENLDALIQTDAAINHGNSGGPLVNASGEVIGINTAVAADGQNIGFAISIDSVQPLIEKLRSGGGDIKASAFLGVTSSDLSNVLPQVLERLGVTAKEGAFVSAVVPGSGAEGAGLQPGDVITEIDGRSVKGSADVKTIVEDQKPGDQVEIRYQRDGQTKTGRATLGSKEVQQSGG